MKTINGIRWVVIVSLFFTLSSGCTKNEAEIVQEELEKTGTFKIDGVEYKGTTSIISGGGMYSVSCQQSNPYKLIQVHFASKEEAEKGGTFKIMEYSPYMTEGEVGVGVDGLTFDPDGSYTVTVKDKKITMSNIQLIQTGTAAKKPLVNACSIAF